MPTTWRVNNSTTLGNFVCAPWVANTAYALGDRVVCTIAYGTPARRAFVYECTTAGTSHSSTEPTWPTSGTVADGASLVWTQQTPGDGDWDNASCFLQYITNHAANSAGGDTIYIDDGHSEAPSANIYNATTGSGAINGSLSFPSPLKIFCVDKADDSLSTGAIVDLSSSGWMANLQFWYSGYSYGVCYKKAGGGFLLQGASQNKTDPFRWVFESSGPTVNIYEGTTSIYNPCVVVRSATHGSWYPGAILIIRNAGISMDGASSWIGANCAKLHLHNSKISAPSEITQVIGKADESDFVTGGIILFEDVDLSAICTGATNRYIVNFSGIGDGSTIDLLRCKLPSGAGFAIQTGTPSTKFGGSRVRLHHCSKIDDTYSFYESNFFGVMQHETTIVRTGGASDGTTAISMKIVSNANVSEQFVWFESTPIHGWTDSTSSATFTIHGVYDSATNLQDDEIWMELEYPANDTDGLGAMASDVCEILGSPADQATSTETWTTTGLTNPNKFKLSVTVTPGKAGPITARVFLAKASTTVYIDPMIIES
jgi:hypothetical protein